MKQLKKIISGGQTGADRAALDTAIKFNIEYGGWVPKGRKAEDGSISLKYNLQEMNSTDYRERTKQNIIDSHGTVIISRGELTGGSLLTKTFAKVIGRPNCHIDVFNSEEFEAAVILKQFILENGIQVLNVAGPRMSHDPAIYEDVKIILEAVFHMFFLETEEERVLKTIKLPENIAEVFPADINEAVEILAQDLTLKFKTFIARLETDNISYLYFAMQDYIRQRLGFDSSNETLLHKCAVASETDRCSVEDGIMVIIKQLKLILEKDHVLKVVK